MCIGTIIREITVARGELPVVQHSGNSCSDASPEHQLSSCVGAFCTEYVCEHKSLGQINGAA